MLPDVLQAGAVYWQHTDDLVWLRPNSTMTRFIAPYLLSILLLVASCFASDAAADRVYRNGTVFTDDPQNPIAESVAILEGQIVYVGSNEGVVPFIGPSTKVTDLRGGFLMPGLVEGHLHPREAGMTLRKG